MDWMAFQETHRRWVDVRFPNQPPGIPAAGMVEEAGELLHAVLALERERIWGPDPRYPRLLYDLADAIGDCVIYVCSWCNASHTDFRRVFPTHEVIPYVHVLEGAKDLVRHAINQDKILYMDSVIGIAKHFGIDFEEAAKKTLDRVVSRKPKPVTVCLCGSTRFKHQFIKANFQETLAGHIVLSVGWFSHADRSWQPNEEQKLALDELHKRKIDAASEILVLDCEALMCTGCSKHTDDCKCITRPDLQYKPYIGSSTRSEIEYATTHGKRVRYWSQENS